MMGIGTTVKNMLGSENAPQDTSEQLNQPTERLTHDVATSNKLPAGTGPGTSGKATTGQYASAADPDTFQTRTAEAGLSSSQGQDISGYGTDAAAASGGTLDSTHQADRSGGRKARSGSGSSKRNSTGLNESTGLANTGRSQGAIGGPSGVRDSQLDTVIETTIDTRAGVSDSSGVQRSFPETNFEGRTGRTGVLPAEHHFGHVKHNPKDSMPGENADEDTNQLQPVTHERIRHFETEEVIRVKDIERHVHHIQHHTQPIVASEELAERIRENSYPMTIVKETHANKVEDNTLFEGQVNQYHDTLTHAAKERTVIDKGVQVREHVHHHIHHVIQPIIEKETIDKHRIVTTIPIREITHEAPVVHQSQTHAPVPLEHFLQRGGTLSGAIGQDEITKKMLRSGQCLREVDGVAEQLERELKLGRSSVGRELEGAAVDKEMLKKSSRQQQPTTTMPTVVTARN
ncbi:hypothetical protein D9619_009320 [Psilocybe cf. subviscida]|uniref:Allergen n=1 Tax=Psilocybe cf. subviscida TaxID=2480587 RepID=A0A8H5BTW8_9AGAR|nr:hypothetical protein D9619_009320 [Psilocybe cf. subviscida]